MLSNKDQGYLEEMKTDLRRLQIKHLDATYERDLARIIHGIDPLRKERSLKLRKITKRINDISRAIDYYLIPRKEIGSKNGITKTL